MRGVVDGWGGVQTVIHSHNDGSGDVTFETRQDTSAILDNAKRMHNEGMHGSSEMKLAARLPMVAIDSYCATHQITFEEFQRDKKHIRAMLNDPDLKAFRIWPGRV
jgi:hypothetical protein